MQRISVETFLAQRERKPLFDVRAPAEHARGHIPGVHNMPLFTDAERAAVGTAYKKLGPRPALLEGLDLVAPKMRGFVERVEKETDPSRQVALHCWRGGKRSESVAWLLEFAGFEVQVLEGGYKAYRQHLHRFFRETPLQLIILGGYTGSGKTDILHALAEQGQQVVDLEALASHRGSAFGALGQEEQPTTEQFENDLFDAFFAMDRRRPIWLENESRAIGRVFLPQGLWEQMMVAPLVHLDIPLHLRIDRLNREYCTFPEEEIVAALGRIRKRLGGQHHQAALAAVQEGKLAEAVAIALRYYDKAYRHGSLHSRSESATPYELPFDKDDPAAAAQALLDYTRAHVWTSSVAR